MDVGAVRAQLDELGVDASSLRTVPIEEAPDVVLAFDVDPTTWFDTWQQLRNVVGALGMWPLATSHQGWPLATSHSGSPPEEISRAETQGPDGLDATPSAILARVPDLDVDRLLQAEQASQRQQCERWPDYESHLASMIGTAAPRHGPLHPHAQTRTGPGRSPRLVPAPPALTKDAGVSLPTRNGQACRTRRAVGGHI